MLSSVAYFLSWLIVGFKSYRSSGEIFVDLPMFGYVQDAVSVASSWLKKSMPFIAAASSEELATVPLLKLEALKVHVISRLT